MIHTVKGFLVVNEAEVDDFLEFPSFLYDPTDDGYLISVSSAFSKFSLYIWEFLAHLLLSLAWRILSIIFLAREISEIVQQFDIHLHCLSLGLEYKLTSSSPVATTEFSKFDGILGTAL